MKTENTVTTKAKEETPDFTSLGLSEKLLSIITKLGFTQPTPIQHASIPAAIEGKDILGIAQTGTGKTLAFGLPMVQRLLNNDFRGLIISPTRELAQQVETHLKNICRPLNINTAVLIGGDPIYKQKKALQNKPRIIVATPGRLIDHLKQGSIQLKNVGMLVLDEADRMLDMGFTPQINEILKRTPAERQTLLFSATMPPEIVKLTTSYMKMPVRIEVAPAGSVADKVEQEIILVKNEGKIHLLEELLKENEGSCLVFSRTRHGTKKICAWLRKDGLSAAEIHADRSQGQRREALDGFSKGKYRVLVATDVAARGIDVSHVGLVINFDLPDNSDDYIHRIGRTGRAGRSGKAISFASPDQKRNIREIERLIRQTIKTSSRTGLTLERGSEGSRFDKDSKKRQSRGGRSSRWGQRSNGNNNRSRDRNNDRGERNDRGQVRGNTRGEYSDRSTRGNSVRGERTNRPARGDVNGNSRSRPEQTSRGNDRGERGQRPPTNRGNTRGMDRISFFQ